MEVGVNMFNIGEQVLCERYIQGECKTQKATIVAIESIESGTYVLLFEDHYCDVFPASSIRKIDDTHTSQPNEETPIEEKIIHPPLPGTPVKYPNGEKHYVINLYMDYDGFIKCDWNPTSNIENWQIKTLSADFNKEKEVSCAGIEILDEPAISITSITLSNGKTYVCESKESKKRLEDNLFIHGHSIVERLVWDDEFRQITLDRIKERYKQNSTGVSF